MKKLTKIMFVFIFSVTLLIMVDKLPQNASARLNDLSCPDEKIVPEGTLSVSADLSILTLNGHGTNDVDSLTFISNFLSADLPSSVIITEPVLIGNSPAKRDVITFTINLPSEAGIYPYTIVGTDDELRTVTWTCNSNIHITSIPTTQQQLDNLESEVADIRSILNPPDLVVTHNQIAGNPDGVSILSGIGGGLFGPAVIFETAEDPRFVAVKDFNGDTNDDLAVANFNSDNISLLLGTGTGSFVLPLVFPVGTNPASLTIGDFNEDTNDDLAVTNRGDSSINVLLGDGAGSFNSIREMLAGAAFPIPIITGDFNNDTKIDLAVANSFFVSILLGNGLGSFGPATNFYVGDDSFSLASGNFN